MNTLSIAMNHNESLQFHGSSELREESQTTESHEVAIAVMGVTGVGKSYFIREVSGLDVTTSGGLESCTSVVQEYRFPFEFANINTTVTLVDTPGFNDTFRSDADILKEIAQWMASTYRSKISNEELP